VKCKGKYRQDQQEDGPAGQGGGSDPQERERLASGPESGTVDVTGGVSAKLREPSTGDCHDRRCSGLQFSAGWATSWWGPESADHQMDGLTPQDLVEGLNDGKYQTTIQEKGSITETATGEPKLGKSSVWITGLNTPTSI
jgi:hypothetical protein